MKLKTWFAIGTFAFAAWRGVRRMKREVRHGTKDLRLGAKRSLKRAAKAI